MIISDIEDVILVVDDNPINVAVASGYLKKYGYRVLTADSGEMALAEVAHSKPSLILLDIEMPGMSGFSVCQQLKLNACYADIPVIFLTAQDSANIKDQAFSVGGVDYLSKPFQKIELIARVRNHLSIAKYQRHLNNLLEEKSNTLKELQRTQDELVESRKMASLVGLITGISHELNTPLSITILAATSYFEELKTLKNLFENEQLGADQLANFIDSSEENYHIIANSFEKLSKLVNTFKELSLRQTQGDEVTINLHKYLQTCLINFQEKIAVRLDCDRGINIKISPWLLKSSLDKLIDNTLVHGFNSGDEKSAELVVNKRKNRLVIDYYDAGKGIENSVINEVFEPFFTTNRSNGHLGLGLHIVFNIVVHLLKGSISCHASNSGAHFRISFPIEEVNADE